MEILAKGAEALIKKDGNKVIKERIKKNYRIFEIDDDLRAKRTKTEAKNIKKAGKIVSAPNILAVNEAKAIIEMEFIEGNRLSDVLEQKSFISILKKIGADIACLHNNNIIHGDLTTSNFILRDSTEPVFIDMGLSFHSVKVEDKAVDLHLLKEALISRHYTIWEECFQAALNGYMEESDNAKEIIERLDKVELRGRNKSKSR